MTRETRIGLLVGLAFIVAFGLILSELTAPEQGQSPRVSGAGAGTGAGDAESAYAWKPAVSERTSSAEDQPAEYVPAVLEETPVSPAAGSAATPAPENRKSPSAQPPAAAAPQTAAARPTAAAASRRIYVVQANDSLIRIAKKVYGPGRGSQYKRIFAANRNILSDEATVFPGQRLVIPPLGEVSSSGGTVARSRASSPLPARRATARRRYVEMDLAQLGRHFGVSPSRSRRRMYVVRRGDNLTAIARKTLNDASISAVMKIFNANRDKLHRPDRLPVGVRLAIPG